MLEIIFSAPVLSAVLASLIGIIGTGATYWIVKITNTGVKIADTIHQMELQFRDVRGELTSLHSAINQWSSIYNDQYRELRDALRHLEQRVIMLETNKH